jgi:NAD(P)H dehydrogenase (quinone)
MSKTLIVTAHPSSRGFTHAIAGVLKERREASGVDVEILDLYKTDLKIPYLTYENIRELAVDPVRVALQQKLLDANEVIFVHPLWWFGQPAIMKNFLDQTLMPRFAYRFIEGKRVGLLKGRTARVYITCDGPIWLYTLLGLPFVTMWVVGTLVFCGYTVEKFSITRMLTLKTDEERKARLQKIKKNANRKSLILRLISFIGNL